jgi:beta-lactamase class A
LKKEAQYIMKFSPLKYSLLLTAITVTVINICMPSFAASTQQIKPASIARKLAELETSFDGRIGILTINTANNQRIQYRADERFPIQSTFKVMAVSAILKQSMTDKHFLQQKVTYKKQDLVFWSPITEKHLADGMTISELCAAAMMYSDNTATNLIVKKLGGPSAVTAFARSIGDNTFRIDSWEPELNSNPSDPRDTSTLTAMEKSLQKLTLGNVLASPQREQLITWMKGNTTGDTRIRAGVPKGWIVADKTGAGDDYGISNDIGIIWPPSCAPIVVTIYSVHNKKDTTRRDDVIASATRMLINEFAQTDKCVKRKYD